MTTNAAFHLASKDGAIQEGWDLRFSQTSKRPQTLRPFPLPRGLRGVLKSHLCQRVSEMSLSACKSHKKYEQASVISACWTSTPWPNLFSVDAASGTPSSSHENSLSHLVYF